jgi:hypothetical protein
VLQVPAIDAQQLVDNGFDIGPWPSGEGKTNATWLTPFMRLLISADPAASRALDRLPKDLLDASPAQLKDVAAVAKSVKVLFADLAANPETAIRMRLAAAGAQEPGNEQLAALLADLPPSQLAIAQQWFADAKPLVARPPPKPPAKPVAPAKPGQDLLSDDAAPAQPPAKTPAGNDLLNDDPAPAKPPAKERGGGDLLADDPPKAAAPPAKKPEAANDLLEDDAPAKPAAKPAPAAVPASKPSAAPANDLLTDDAPPAPKPPAAPAVAPPVSPAPAAATPPAAHAPSAPTKPIPGWFVDANSYSISFRPLGHGNKFLRAWLEKTRATTTSPKQLRDVNRELRGDGGAAASCIKCHALPETDVSRQIIWSPAQRPDGRGFEKFSHAPHMMQIGTTCTTCHTPAKTAALGVAARHDFLSMKKETCMTCHVKSLAGDNCLTCHNYHIELKPLRDILLTVKP